MAIKVLPDEFAQDEERLRRFQREAEMTRDGKSLVIRRADPHSQSLAELVWMPLEGDSAPVSLVTWPSWPFSFRLSPNGRLLAYVDRRPVDRVMVMSLEGEERMLLGDGEQPIWARDSRSLFYRSGEQLIEAELTTSPTLAVARQTVVIDDAGEVMFSDVTSDGRGFLALTPVEHAGGSEILVSVNWAPEKVQQWRNR